MAVHGPDSGYSWVIVLCCAFIHFALFGLYRSAGVMYVAMLQNYDVTREEASWPFSLCAAVFQLVGPLGSMLVYYVSQRKVCLLGSAIATLGVAGCYFADSVMWINVSYGLIHGLGFGLVVTVIPVTLSQYFVKYRATAMGIAFSGGTISSMIFPGVMEWLLENYTLKDSFLLLSCVVMNMLVASSMLRTPPWLKESPDVKSKLLEDGPLSKDATLSTPDTQYKDAKPSADTLIESELLEPVLKEDNSKMDQSLYQVTNKSQHDISNGAEDSGKLGTFCSNYSVSIDVSNSKANGLEKNFNTDRDDLNRSELEVKEPLMSGKKIIIVPKENVQPDNLPRKSIRHSIHGILKEPIFHLLAYTMCIYMLGVHSFFMVIVDFAKDQGIPERKAIYIISMFSLTDLFGRACLGWVTDRNFIRRKTMVALNLGILGVVNQLYPVIDSLSGILVVSAIHGLAVGSSITLFFVLQAECLGMDRLVMVVGMIGFINGISSLFRPSITGLFRDVIGSYNWMFHFVGFISLVFSVLWLLESRKSKEVKSSKDVRDITV